MSITVEQIQGIKLRAEQRRRSVERARGSMDQLMKTLKDDFGCETVEEAKQKLEELKEKGVQASNRIEKLKARVVSLWEQVENPGTEEEQE